MVRAGQREMFFVQLSTWKDLKPKKFSIVFVCWNKIRQNPFKESGT